jgi:Na+/melibiose symporter-like transporter
VGWMLVPGILLFICFILLKWYPLSGSSWDEIKNKLEKKHREKEKQYLESKGFKFN